MMRNFLFDLYGTLVDIRTDEDSDAFWAEIARLLHTEEGERVRSTYARLCEAAQRLLPADGEIDLLGVFEKLLSAFSEGDKERKDALAFAHAFRDASLKKLCLFDGVEELLCGIHVRGGGVYLLSNAQACFTRRELGGVGIAEMFDGILLSSEAGCKKPSPRFFRTAFEKFSLGREDCIYVGNDLFDDVGGAHAAGIPCVYIQTEQSRPGGAHAPVPDEIAKDRRALARILFAYCERGQGQGM